MAHAAPNSDRLSIVESRMEDLACAVEALEQRLALLEKGGAEIRRHAAVGGPLAAAPEDDEEILPPGLDVTRILTLTGRTLIVFGGAYLLRAVTAAGYLPEQAGVLLAFLYALTWLFLADRTAVKGDAASASFHGGTAVLIGLPLLWEATARFHYLAPSAAGLAVAVFAAAALAVAWRRSLHGLAWMVGLVTPVTALGLLAATHQTWPFALDLVLLGVGGLWLYYGRGWRAVGWWMALLGGLGGFLAAFGGLAQRRDQTEALAIGLLLCLAYLGTLALRTLREREVGIFEGVQSGLAVLFGYGGAALVARALGGGAVWLAGVLGLLLAAGAYWTAFRIVPRAERRKLLLYSLLALAFTLASGGLLLPARPLAIAWSVLAVVSGWLAVRLARVTLALHGTFYSLAAAAASGLLMTALYAFATPAGTAWPPLTPQALFALLAAAAVCALPVPHPAPFWKPYEGLTRVLRIAVFLWGAAGAALYFLAPALAGIPGQEGCDAGVLATVRTAVLTAVALLLGWASCRQGFREAAWLVYPTLGLAVLKLAIEDFPNGRPATLFLALAMCGLAFLFAPRLARRTA